MKFGEVTPIEKVLELVDGILQISAQIRTEINALPSDPESLRLLSGRTWSLSSTVTDCIFDLSEHVRQCTTAYNVRHSTVINKPASSAKAAELEARNDPEYVNMRFEVAQKYENLLSYMINVKGDLDKAHYMCKEMYTRQTEILISKQLT